MGSGGGTEVSLQVHGGDLFKISLNGEIPLIKQWMTFDTWSSTMDTCRSGING